MVPPHPSIAIDSLSLPCTGPLLTSLCADPAATEDVIDPRRATNKNLCVIVHVMVANNGEPCAAVMVDCVRLTVSHRRLVYQATTFRIIGLVKP
jgi:hypothetical protein